jgi:hypothetical protein
MSVQDHTTSTLASARRRSESGVGMLSTLVVVIIMGVIVTVVLTHTPGTKPSSSANISNGDTTITTSTTPKSIGTEAQLAAVSGCETNYLAVTTAIETYSTENGTEPPAGTAWATSDLSGGPFLQSWPTSPRYYTITWNGHSVGVTPAKGTPSIGTAGSSAPPTGCYAA